MKVKCLFNKGSFLPPEILKKQDFFETEYHLDINKEYVVYGIASWNGVICYFITDYKSNYPSWYPADLFVIVDYIFSAIFYFNYAPTMYLKAIFAYKELALDLDHHDNLVEIKQSDMRLFFKRQKEIDEASNDTHGWYYDYQPTSMKVVLHNDTAQEPIQYQVYGIHLHNDVVRYLLELNEGHLNWYPADQCALKNNTQPIEWYFNYTQEHGALWGYKALILDPQHEADLLAGKQAALALFNEYKHKVYEWELACQK